MPTSPFSSAAVSPWRPPRRRGPLDWLLGWLSGLIRFVLATVLFFTLMTFVVYWLFGHVFIPPGDLRTPDVRGKDFLEAAKLLRDQNLSIKWEGEQPSESIEEGGVISQDPVPDKPIKKGTAVKVLVSGGIALVNLPDVRHVPQNRAQFLLRKAGLEVGNRTMLPSLGDPVGTVLETDPPAGTGIPQGSRVNLLVATGQTRVTRSMPTLSGMMLERAREVLTDSGLFATEVEVAQASAAAGQVVGQSPAPGEAVSDSTHIILKYTPQAAGIDVAAEGVAPPAAAASLTSTTQGEILDEGAIPAVTLPGVTGTVPGGAEPAFEEFPTSGSAVDTSPADLEEPVRPPR